MRKSHFICISLHFIYIQFCGPQAKLTVKNHNSSLRKSHSNLFHYILFAFNFVAHKPSWLWKTTIIAWESLISFYFITFYLHSILRPTSQIGCDLQTVLTYMKHKKHRKLMNYLEKSLSHNLITFWSKLERISIVAWDTLNHSLRESLDHSLRKITITTWKSHTKSLRKSKFKLNKFSINIPITDRLFRSTPCLFQVDKTTFHCRGPVQTQPIT